MYLSDADADAVAAAVAVAVAGVRWLLKKAMRTKPMTKQHEGLLGFFHVSSDEIYWVVGVD